MTDQAEDRTWSIQLTAEFEVIDPEQIADSAESFIYDENSAYIYRLDTLGMDDDPMDRGDAFCAWEDSLYDAQDPNNSLWVAFMMFIPPWAGLRGSCDATTSIVGSSRNRVRVEVTADEVSIADLDALEAWLGKPARSDDWIEAHIVRFVADLHGAMLIDIEVDSTPDYEPDGDS